MKYLIIDDEPAAHKLISRFAQNYPELKLIGQCFNAMQAQTMMQEYQIDLIFLDINMPQMTGFEFLTALKQPPQIVVISAHQEYALESYEYEITDYLLKPFNAERFAKAIQKITDKHALITSRLQSEASPHALQESIFIKDDKKHHQVALSELLYVKANGNYTSVYLKDTQLLSQMKISDFEQLLPEEYFSRVHRSYIVAHHALTLIKASEVHIGDVIVPVGRVYKEKVAQLIKK